MKKEDLVNQLLETRMRIDAKLAELGEGNSDRALLLSLQGQLGQLQASVNALANRGITVNVPEREIHIHQTPVEAGDLEVVGPGGRMSIKRIRKTA